LRNAQGKICVYVVILKALEVALYLLQEPLSNFAQTICSTCASPELSAPLVQSRFYI
jgi:hypothetical protein